MPLVVNCEAYRTVLVISHLCDVNLIGDCSRPHDSLKVLVPILSRFVKVSKKSRAYEVEPTLHFVVLCAGGTVQICSSKGSNLI